MRAGETGHIQEAAVLGAGVMGAAIAAHLANAGVTVHLLDIVPDGATDRDTRARTAIQNMLKQDPAPFTHKRNAKRVLPGNFEDHLDRLARCDWIVEAIVERQDVKQDLYAKVEASRKAGSVVSSNTSTIPLAALVDGMPESFRQDFLITHFFNPPRYMRLLELVAGERTRPEAVETVRRFADRGLGKTCIDCNDTPGFVANRIGIYWLLASVVHAVNMDVSVEEADAVIGKPFGIPKTGVFGLMDMVGIDLMPHVVGSMRHALPTHDPFHAIDQDVPVIHRMIEAGYTGRKGKGGFYRINRAGGGKVKEAVNLKDFTYAPAQTAEPECLEAAKAGGAAALLSQNDKVARYARAVMGGTLAYAASLIPDVHTDPAAIDEAIRLGYNWKQGPFELIDAIGAQNLAQALRAEGQPVPPFLEKVGNGSVYRTVEGRLEVFRADGQYHAVERPEGVLRLADVQRASKPVARNGSASLWDLGDGVACLEFHTKMNAIDDKIFEMIHTSIATVQERFKALVLHNEGSNFSAGANLGLALFAANTAAWDQLQEMVATGQRAYRALKYAPFPVVGAPSGMALGGGCEALLHCDAVEAHMETYAGLVEAGVGVVPAWGGCTEMLDRLAHSARMPKGPMPAPTKAFETISVATVAKSAEEAKDHGFLRPDDGITMNRDRVLAAAKARALGMAESYQPPEAPEFHLPGRSGKAAMDMAVDQFTKQGKTTPHDITVAGELAEVLSGGPEVDHIDPVGEDHVLAQERAAFMRLLKTEPTLDRIEHMLETGKPLRN
jgi:3-hydroxyacyl-CoA dehydrogenase